MIKYANGNIKVQLDPVNGSKVRFIPKNEEEAPEFPESMDIKITNKCDQACPFCHENSTINGKHGNLSALLHYLSQANFPSGVELAIGGGNPLEHPDLVNFLESATHQLGLICNLTVHPNHYEKDPSQISDLMDKKLIMGLGISGFPKKTPLKYPERTVHHQILGVHFPPNPENHTKILLLGYKNVGKDKYTPNLRSFISWSKAILNTQYTVYLDTLAVKQLGIINLINQTYYMGDDGNHTMYIDAINQTYAPSSTDKHLAKPITLNNLKGDFKDVRRYCKSSGSC